MAKIKRNELEIENLKMLVSTGQKQYVSYEEGTKLYSLGRNTFIELAKEARAIRKIGTRVIVNVNILNEFIETVYTEEEDYV